MRDGDFDLKALHAALDQQRQARGLSWAAATRAISGSGPLPSRRPVASTTITTLRTKVLAEADGVLAMLRWLGRAPESFVGDSPPALAAEAFPEIALGSVPRVDTRKLYEALNQAREVLGLTWPEVEAATRVPASHLRGLARGGRTAFPFVTRLTRWLCVPASQFVRQSPY